MGEEETRHPVRPLTESEAAEDASRGAEVTKRLYPVQSDKGFMPFVSRYRGPFPDFYNIFPLLAYNVRRAQGKAMCEAAKIGTMVNGQARVDWEAAMDDPLIDLLEEHTVSLGGGKGRAEGVELGKSNPPVAQRSRWGFRRRGEL